MESLRDLKIRDLPDWKLYIVGVPQTGEQNLYFEQIKDEFKDVLKALALAVVGAEGSFAGATDAQRLDVMGAAAQSGLDSVGGLIALRGELGVSEARIEDAAVRIEGEISILGQARNNFVTKDPFVAASEFAALEAQLQAVFQVTARLSSLSLNNFLR